jgi:hypothetical protein
MKDGRETHWYRVWARVICQTLKLAEEAQSRSLALDQINVEVA